MRGYPAHLSKELKVELVRLLGQSHIANRYRLGRGGNMYIKINDRNEYPVVDRDMIGAVYLVEST